MRKLLSIAYIFVFFLSINTISKNFILSAQTQVSVESVSVSNNIVSTICPMPDLVPPIEGRACGEEQTHVKVSVKISAENENNLTFYYVISGGKIIGNGSEVIWDLSQTRPGRYSITVGVGKDNVLSGKTLTKSVDIEECGGCDPPCVCPSLIKITGPQKSAKEGDIIVLSASVAYSDKKEFLKYNWKITNGEIIKGQQTDQILVRVNQKFPNKQLVVLLEVETTNFCECPITSENFEVNIDKKD